jgi:hypothetical protein
MDEFSHDGGHIKQGIAVFGLILLLVLSFPSTLVAQNNVLDFDGIDDRADAGFNSAFEMGTSDITIELWLKTTKSGVRQNLVTARHSDTIDRYIFYINSSNQAAFYVHEGGSNFNLVTSTTLMNDALWHHVAVVRHYSSREIEIYVDGELENSATVPGSAAAVSLNQAVSIGADYYPSPGTSVINLFQGQMDELRLWKKAKTSSEIRADYYSELTGAETDLAVYYDFNQGIPAGDNTAITVLAAQSATLDADLYNFSLTGSSSNFVAKLCGFDQRLFPLENPGSWTATASSELNGTLVAGEMIDNDVVTYWHSANSVGSSIDVDMGAEKSIAGLQYFYYTNTNARFTDFDVLTSTDGTNFTSRKTGTLSTGLADGEYHAQFIEFPAEVTARYYRLKSTSARAYVGGAELMPLACSTAGEFVPSFKPGTCDYEHLGSASLDGSTTYSGYRYGHNWHLAKIASGTLDSATATAAEAVTAWQRAVVNGAQPAGWVDPGSFSSPAVLAADWVSSSYNGGHSGNVDYLYRLDFQFTGNQDANSSYNQELFALQPAMTLNLYSDNAIYNLLLNGNVLTPTSGSYSSSYINDGFSAEGKDLEWVIEPTWLVGGINTLVVHMRSAGTNAGFMAAVHTSGTCSSTTYDFGDAPDTYGTSAAESGAAHAVTANLVIGTGVSAEDDGYPAGSDSSDNGVIFNTAGGGGSITAQVTGTNNTGSSAMLCGYMDGMADGSKDNLFSRNITYTGSVGDGSGDTAASGNEELCIQVPGTAASTAVILSGVSGFNGASAACTTETDKTFSCNLNFNPDFQSTTSTYARFRLTTDSEFFSNNSPSPTGLAADGEVEDYQLTYDPTSVTIDYIAIESAPVDDFLASFDNDGLDALLHSYSPGSRGWTGGADRQEQLEILNGLLDPDNDGEVAIVKWSTFDEHGTVGFHLDRNEASLNNWIGVTRELLPALGDAPLGGEYLYADPGALPGVDYFYRLTEQEAWGRTKVYGPYRLRYDSSSSRP